MKTTLCTLILTLFLVPSVLFAQENTTTATSNFATEASRLAELQARYENQTITEAELQEYASMNDANPDLQQYLPPEPTQAADPEASGTNEAFAQPSTKDSTFIRSDIYQQTADAADRTYNLVVVLAGIVFINLLLTLYVMFRKRHT